MSSISVSGGRSNEGASEAKIAPFSSAGIGWWPVPAVVLLTLAGLTGFAVLKHLLFPTLTPLEYQAMTVGIGAAAAGISAYYVLRKLERLVAMHSRAEMRLALERKLLRTVTDNVRESIFAKDTQGRYLFVNKPFARLHGVDSPDWLLGKTAFDLFSGQRAADSHSDDLRVMRVGGAVLERERSVADDEGNLKWVLTTKVPLIGEDGTILGVVGVHRDITRSKQDEQRLRQSEANLAAAQRIAHFGSFELDVNRLDDLEDHPLRWSDEIFRIFGYPPGGTEASVRNFLAMVHPDDRERVGEGVAQAISEAASFGMHYRIIQADGAERIVQEWGEVVCDPSTRRPLKLVGSIQDVTDRQRAEMELQEVNQRLAERVKELQRRSQEITALSEMGSWLQSCHTTGEASLVIASAAEKLFPEWGGALCALSASKNAVEVVAEWGLPLSVERVFAPDDCWALRRSQPHRFRDGDNGARRCRHMGRGTVAQSLCLPLTAHGEALGILTLQRCTVSGRADEAACLPSAAEERLGAVLAEQVGLALGNLKLKETLRNQSIRDALTGLFNRRYMEESLEREISRASRKGTSVAILMADLDHFKQFNDTFGHQAGDALLRAFGDFLAKCTRRQDIACRLGGEEFAMVLSDASLEGALSFAEQMRGDVKNLHVQYGGQLLGSISLSVGVALFPDHGPAIGDVIRAADQALYSAKRDGRDRVCLWAAKPVV